MNELGYDGIIITNSDYDHWPYFKNVEKNLNYAQYCPYSYTIIIITTASAISVTTCITIFWTIK